MGVYGPSQDPTCAKLSEILSSSWHNISKQLHFDPPRRDISDSDVEEHLHGKTTLEEEGYPYTRKESAESFSSNAPLDFLFV